jgi:mono/diheme cytochrome c family protein
MTEKHNFLYKVVFLFVIFTAGCGYAPMFDKNPLPMSSEIVEDGRVLYETHCITCHGVSGKGDGVVAGSLPIKPADLTQLPLFPQGFIEFKIKTGSDTEYMPAWDGVIKDSEIQKIGHYLRSIKSK